MKKITVALVFLLCVLNMAMAFDNKRSGFIIGGLGGVALVNWNQSIDGIQSESMNDFAVHLDLRLGGGFQGDKFMLYYWQMMNFLSMTNWLGIDVAMISSNGGAGLTYYFLPTSPSFYVNAGVGASIWAAASDDPSDYWYGLGLMGGVGYEFSRHWSMELGIMWGNPSIEAIDFSFNSHKLQTNALAVSLSLIGIAY
ncbi:MAG TPA: hypothetical protein VMX75_03115 [Spirochaetia bacterium]|nr:hypothetical protein [Spirochaetia bacterium]